jgi:GT2 family glycosyltransferase
VNDLVSVIILNWNGKAYLPGCLDSVLAQDYSPVETIVVDNASGDGSPDLIRSGYKDVLLIETGQNLGFGGGNNIGIDRAKGKHILILNNDAELDRACVGEMMKALAKDAGYGACASKIYVADPPDTLDAAGITVFPDGLSLGRGRLKDGSLYDLEEEVFFASGCTALYRREMLEDIRLSGEYYDADFFAYADDTDLGWRARLRGWRCIYAPTAKAWHLHSASTSPYSAFKAYLVERNRIWLLIKNFPPALIAYGQLFTLLRYGYQSFGALSGRGASGEFAKTHSKGQLLSILFRAYRDGLKGLPRMAAKRRVIQGRRKVSTGEMLQIIRRYGITARDIALSR